MILCETPIGTFSKRNTIPQTEHPGDFIFFFLSLFFHFFQQLRIPEFAESLFNVTCVAQVPQAPAEAALGYLHRPLTMEGRGCRREDQAADPFIVLGPEESFLLA